MADNHTDGERTKRFRKDESADPMNPQPSIVVHIRNLSPKATEADVLEALSPFGTVAYATCVSDRKMALAEFEDINAAKSCVNYAQTNQIYVAGQPAQFNYSTSKSIQRVGFESETPNNIVVITVNNAQYPINVDIIYQICKPHGEVKRIVVLRRMGVRIQALVEFDAVESARKAKHALNGADIYSGCCTIKIEFAKANEVRVSRNDSDQWDYTLYPADEKRQGLLGPMAAAALQTGQQRAAQPYGNVSQNYGRSSAPVPQSYNPNSYNYGSNFNAGFQQQPTYPGVHQAGPMPQQGFGVPQEQLYGGASSVLMVYGVDPEKMNCDKLFNLLCIYGNVIRIKFMKSKSDTAMVQMGDPIQVQVAIDNLREVEFDGQQLSFRASKQPTLREIRDPYDLPDGEPSFKDYSDSRNNRFLTPEAAQRNRIAPPSSTLHWFNAPSNMTEESMTKILSANGAPVPKKVIVFPIKSERSSNGLAEFEDVEQALICLTKNNHTPVDSPLGKIPYIVKLAFTYQKRERGEQRQYNTDKK